MQLWLLDLHCFGLPSGIPWPSRRTAVWLGLWVGIKRSREFSLKDRVLQHTCILLLFCSWTCVFVRMCSVLCVHVHEYATAMACYEAICPPLLFLNYSECLYSPSPVALWMYQSSLNFHLYSYLRCPRPLPALLVSFDCLYPWKLLVKFTLGEFSESYESDSIMSSFCISFLPQEILVRIKWFNTCQGLSVTPRMY